MKQNQKRNPLATREGLSGYQLLWTKTSAGAWLLGSSLRSSRRTLQRSTQTSVESCRNAEGVRSPRPQAGYIAQNAQKNVRSALPSLQGRAMKSVFAPSTAGLQFTRLRAETKDMRGASARTPVSVAAFSISMMVRCNCSSVINPASTNAGPASSTLHLSSKALNPARSAG